MAERVKNAKGGAIMRELRSIEAQIILFGLRTPANFASGL